MERYSGANLGTIRLLLNAWGHRPLGNTQPLLHPSGFPGRNRPSLKEDSVCLFWARASPHSAPCGDSSRPPRALRFRRNLAWHPAPALHSLLLPTAALTPFQVPSIAGHLLIWAGHP